MYAQIPYGNPLDEGVLLGPLIDEDAVRQFEEAVQTTCISKGRYSLEEQGLIAGSFVQPTIIRANEHAHRAA